MATLQDRDGDRCINREETLGVCVLNWNSGDALKTCLSHLRQATESLPARIVVVDNASSDNSLKLAEAELTDAFVVRNSINVGYAVGNNIGARELLQRGCKYLLFVNPDVRVAPDTVLKLIDAMRTFPSCGCIGGIPKSPAGELMFAARTRPSPFQKLVLYGHLHVIPGLAKLCGEHFIMASELHLTPAVYSVCGACVAFRGDAFTQSGGFDEATFLYEEEMIMAERLIAHGWQTRVCTDAVYSHQGGQATSLIYYRRRLYLIESEYHLLTAYYSWHIVSAALLRLYRYAEWSAYVAISWVSSRTLKARPSSTRSNVLSRRPGAV